MSFFQLVVLAIVQGITEWLPISSSGHLILVPTLLGWPDQGPLIDAMAHMGTLAALLVYFRKDTVRLVRGAFDVVLGREIDGVRTTKMPYHQSDFHNAKPILEELPGWQTDISRCTEPHQLQIGRAHV